MANSINPLTSSIASGTALTTPATPMPTTPVIPPSQPANESFLLRAHPQLTDFYPHLKPQPLIANPQVSPGFGGINRPPRANMASGFAKNPRAKGLI